MTYQLNPLEMLNAALREAEEQAAGERVRLALLKPGICGHAPRTEAHMCPWKQAHPEDDTFSDAPCDCCEACTEECRADIGTDDRALQL